MNSSDTSFKLQTRVLTYIFQQLTALNYYLLLPNKHRRASKTANRMFADLHVKHCQCQAFITFLCCFFAEIGSTYNCILKDQPVIVFFS